MPVERTDDDDGVEVASTARTSCEEVFAQFNATGRPLECAHDDGTIAPGGVEEDDEPRKDRA